MSQQCVDLNLYTDSQLGQRRRPQRFVATKATVLFLSPFTVDSNKNTNVFFCSARKQCKESASLLNLLQCYCKRSVGRIYWPAGVIMLTGSLLVALFSLGAIYKCHVASNPTVSPLSLERALAILWLGLITYSSNEE